MNAFRLLVAWRWIGMTALVSAALLGEPLAAGAQEKRVAVGKSATPMGLYQRPAKGGKWQSVAKNAEVFSGDTLVALGDANVTSKNGAVQLTFWPDLTQTSAVPVIESAVVLREGGDADIDLVLDRGRVDVKNLKTKGAAKAIVRFREEKWELTLAEPGSQAVLELFARWPSGKGFSLKPKAEDVPNAEVYLIVLKGQVDLKAGEHQHRMGPPPGPALFHWSNKTGADGPQRMIKLPDWADRQETVKALPKEVKAALDRLQKKFSDKGPEVVLGETLDSKDANDQRLALFGFGAIDDLARLSDSLEDAKRANVRETTVVSLRHWIGREPGQDIKLYTYLVETKKYTKPHAEIVLRLLHSFGEEDLGRPETYESLIAYLKHPRLAIRELARWHLYRIVFAGKDIPYDAAGKEASLETAFKEWKKLIPDGTLPKK